MAETQPGLQALIATPSRKLMKSRERDDDIENEQAIPEHDQSLVTQFAPRQRPDEKTVPKNAWNPRSVG